MEKDTTMLKIVGASWYRTKISSLIILASVILSIGTLFIIYVERPQFDGTYCATAYWTHTSGHRLEFWGQGNDLEEIPRGAARVCYKDNFGRPLMEIETNSHYDDRVQAYAAGALEGALTWKSIHGWWKSVLKECEKDEESEQFCNWLRKLLDTNHQNIRKKCYENRESKHHDPYLHQIDLFYEQVNGMKYGWGQGLLRSAWKRSWKDIPEHTDFLLMNAAGDFQDLRLFYDRMVSISTNQSQSQESISNILFQLSEENEKMRLTMTHTSSLSENDALARILKKYKFNYHHGSSKSKQLSAVPGQNIEFTGYPGVLSSTDEFYTVSGRKTLLAISGIHAQYDENIALDKPDFESSVFLGPRIMAANRLATNPRSWSKVMKLNPSSGSKQWIVADRRILKKFSTLDEDHKHLTENSNFKNGAEYEEQPGLDAEVGERMTSLVWIVDQLPGRLHGEDVTDQIRIDKKQILLNGTPFFEEMFNLSGLPHANAEEQSSTKSNADSTDRTQDITIAFSGICGPEENYVESVTFTLNSLKNLKTKSSAAKPDASPRINSKYFGSKFVDENLDETSNFWRFDHSQQWSWR